MKKIVIILHNLEFGGIQRLVVDDVNELIGRGVDVKIITLGYGSKTNPMAEQCNLPPQDWVNIKFKSSHDILSLVKLIRFLRRENPDTVMTHAWMANNVGRVACFFSRIKKVISFEHSVYDNVKSSKQFFIDKILQNFCYKIIAVSNSVKESLIQHGIKERKILVIYNGIDFEKYSDVGGEGVRESLKIKDSEFVFAFAGRLVGDKNVDLLIRSFASLDGGRLLIVGDGDQRGKLEKIVKESKAASRTQFLGFRQDVASLLKAVDCLVLPSKREGLGIVLLEAMAVGAPVIVANFPAATDVVNDGVSGLIFKLEEGESGLVRKMRDIMDDSYLRDRLSANARENVKKFSIQKHVEELLKIL